VEIRYLSALYVEIGTGLFAFLIHTQSHLTKLERDPGRWTNGPLNNAAGHLDLGQVDSKAIPLRNQIASKSTWPKKLKKEKSCKPQAPSCKLD